MCGEEHPPPPYSTWQSILFSFSSNIAWWSPLSLFLSLWFRWSYLMSWRWTLKSCWYLSTGFPSPSLYHQICTDWNPAMSALWKEHTDTNGSMLSPATRRDGWIQESNACSACLAHKHLIKSCQHLPKESVA